MVVLRLPHEPMSSWESAHSRNQPSRLTNWKTRIKKIRAKGRIRNRGLTRYSTLPTDANPPLLNHPDGGTTCRKHLTRHLNQTIKMFLRVLEIIYFIYFASHIPITLLVDLQALLPEHVYPPELIKLLHWYAGEFKDPMMMDPPAWFKSFVFCEALVQLPFFPVAAYAFLKGGCKWIRTPAIIYSVHVATTLVPILSHILFHKFPLSPHPGPQTLNERLTLVSIYAPYLIIPIMILLTMLFSATYNSPSLKGNAPSKAKKQR